MSGRSILRQQQIARTLRQLTQSSTSFQSSYSNMTRRRPSEALLSADMTIVQINHLPVATLLAGIRLLHIENGFADPTKEDPLLHYLCTAIRRSQSTPPKKRQPITVSLLKIIENELFWSNFPSRDKSAYSAAFTLAFYGFLRASEYTTPSSSQYSSTTHLTVRDVTITTSSLQLHPKRSKTDRYGKSAKLIVGPTHSLTCPVRAMQNYLAIHQRERGGPLFTLQSGKFITRRDVSSITQWLLRSANLD